MQDIGCDAADAPTGWKTLATALKRAYTLDIEQLRLVEQQVALAEVMDLMPSASRADYFNSTILPLLNSEMGVEARKQAVQGELQAVVKTLAAK